MVSKQKETGNSLMHPNSSSIQHCASSGPDMLRHGEGSSGGLVALIRPPGAHRGSTMSKRPCHLSEPRAPFLSRRQMGTECQRAEQRFMAMHIRTPSYACLTDKEPRSQKVGLRSTRRKGGVAI